MSDDEIEFIARARIAVNCNNPSTEHFGVALPNHIAGVVGEVAFADLYDLSYDSIRTVRGGSDGGVDFTVYFGGRPLTFDIKTRAVQRTDLLVKVSKFEHGLLADYFVLARYLDRKVDFLGWEDPKLVECCRPVMLRVPTHVRPVYELRPMRVLDLLMQRRDGSKRSA